MGEEEAIAQGLARNELADHDDRHDHCHIKCLALVVVSFIHVFVGALTCGSVDRDLELRSQPREIAPVHGHLLS